MLDSQEGLVQQISPTPQETPHRSSPSRRILVDLSTATDGYVGISQDTRINYALLSSRFDVSGLVYSLGGPTLPTLKPGMKELRPAVATAIHWASLPWRRRGRSGLAQKLIAIMLEARAALRRSHDIVPIPDYMRTNALWRILFQKTLPSELLPALMKRDYHVTDLSHGAMTDRVLAAPFLGSKRINTKGFDALLCPFPRALRVSPGTTKLVRYHDAIPLLHADTLNHPRDAFLHERWVKACATDSIFICNSPISREELLRIVPEAEARAHVIPCAVLPADARVLRVDIPAVVRTRVSRQSPAPLRGVLESLEKQWRVGDHFRYVISIGTLEPRKNFTTLISAWEQITATTDATLKLVLVANSGWKQEAVLSAIAPHTPRGNILHLQGVTPAELQALLAGAECFVFPSHAEGFGYPAIEALRANCVPVVSDLPVFRWLLEDCALYADPFDPADLAAQIERVVCAEDAAATRAQLLVHRDRVLRRFLPDRVGDQWAELIERTVPFSETSAALTAVQPGCSTR